MAITIKLYIAEKSDKDTAQLRSSYIINTILKQMNSECYLADYLCRVLLCHTIILLIQNQMKKQDHGTLTGFIQLC